MAELAAAGSELGRAQLELYRIMRGPWDRQVPQATAAPTAKPARFKSDDEV